MYDRKNSYTDKIQKAKISEQMRVSLELRDIRDCENETYGCKKEKGIIVENMEEKVYTTPYGKIYYWTAYSGKEKQWLIFLPGLTADHRLFEKQTEALRKDYNCMVWDAPAHGKSRPFTLCFTMEDMADYLKQILEREGIFSPVLVGQSLGGYISQVYMQRYPKSVSGFVSIDSCPLKRKYYTGAELLMLKHTKWMYRSIPWKMLLKFGTEGTSETKYGRKLMVRMMLSYGKKEYCDLADHGFRIFAQAVEKNLPYEIPCPYLVLCGEKDAAGSAKRYNRNWKRRDHCMLVWIPEAGHNSCCDAPDFVNRHIKRFADSLKKDRSYCERREQVTDRI